ncbi:hypothetical protein E3N88_45729 [Mikania micrantha]|uniref:Uncharacterized protein n=1 Tax=Mikania micrantha TaxID=192012 RepID=A0A5N6L8A2_9ASTR|nr:hypothetical protein E3N88_45729 [Mikania micrantha]
MVLSNKKLKQKLRSVLAESLATSESQANQPNRNDSQTHHSFKSLLNSVTQKPKLSKREVRRVKIPSLKPTPDHEIGVQGEESEVVDGGLKKNKKRKREKDVTEGNDLSKKKKKKKKKIKKKKAVKKEEKGVQTATGGNEEQNVTEEIQIKTHTSKEDESIGTKIYVGGIPYYSTVDDIQSFFEACGSITEIDCLTFPETGKFNGIAMISFRTEAAAKRALALDGSDMIYAGNLSWDMTEDELKKFFSDCKISSIRLGKDKETGEFKGFAHVDFADSLSLTMALKLDQKPLFGRPVRISCAVHPKSVNSGSKVDLTINKNEGNARVVNDDVAKKAKSQTCYDCGEKGHLSSSCPNKKVPDVAHTSKILNDVAFDEAEVNKIGDGKLKRRTCYECGEKGHLSSSCPIKKDADVAHTGDKTDDVFDKEEKEADNVDDVKLKRRTCYECGEKGHLSSSCPIKKDADVAHTGDKTDDIFDKEEKEADNVDDVKLKRRTCYACGEKGHLSSSCQKKQAADVATSHAETLAYAVVKDNEKVDYNMVNSISDVEKADVAIVGNDVSDNVVSSISEGKLRRRTCYECGERGHLSSLCPKKQTADMATLSKKGERAGEGVKLEGERPQALAVEGECAGRLEALGEATYDGVPVNGDWRCDVVEYSVRETAGGGAKFDQPGSSQAMEIETDGDEMMWRWPTLVVEKTGEADDGYVVGEKMGVGFIMAWTLGHGTQQILEPYLLTLGQCG